MYVPPSPDCRILNSSAPTSVAGIGFRTFLVCGALIG
jgi:hypothetical protein